MNKTIYCCVNNDLCYDQRMRRICTSLHQAGYNVVLVGRSHSGSLPVFNETYKQVRLFSFFQKGKGMYLIFNIRLFFYLLFRKADLICANDLDTIVPVYFISRIKKTVRVYDAHEWFSEMKEVVTRPKIAATWRAIEKFFLPRFKNGYTVSASIAETFRKLYGVEYEVIRNTPIPYSDSYEKLNEQPYLIYQGAVNEGRGLEWLIPAMKAVNMPLWICGEGNFSSNCRALIREYELEDKVIMKGMIPPLELRKYTVNAYAGINLVEPIGKNLIYSLANKFFDYMHAGIPQLSMRLPEYEKINQEYQIAILIDQLSPESISNALNNLIYDKVLYMTLKEQCTSAAAVYHWPAEEQKLLGLYRNFTQDVEPTTPYRMS